MPEKVYVCLKKARGVTFDFLPYGYNFFIMSARFLEFIKKYGFNYNIELHIERVQSILNQMDLQKKCKFAAWCCNALLIEKKINENMTKITNSNVNYQLCDAIIKAGWYDFSQINIGISQKAIEDINWDDDDPLNDMVET